MTTLDDKLLGEKLHYYCSSSEDEEEGATKKGGNSSDKDRDEDESSSSSRTAATPAPSKLKFIPESAIRENEGYSTNTGPKGVIRDWQRFKQLESEKRQQQEEERLMLAKKLSATTRSHLEEERDKQKGKSKPPAAASAAAAGDSDDEVMAEYLEKRMKELIRSRKKSCNVFGRIFELDSADAFLDSADNVSKTALVLILLYEDRAPGCASMKNALQYLATEYPTVKFCQVKSSKLNVSMKFKTSGLPALLAYRNGDLVGNYVDLVKEFGEEIYGSDVESFLIEHGVLQDRTLVPSILRTGKQTSNDDDSD
ncbi:putative Phosducin-like protein [Hypsibius exemplaris]|uniref:Phosducin-like protein n=1 Tax=Hypsibius exemplaris TaxID=2072580 RepID=A0A1W0XA82_HYPEX|nr:putative Phosducin-like protein [Hypsibius exemplaris]